MKPAIAIVGAGISGSVCARLLADRGYTIQVFDKGRGPGGRMSARRNDSGQRFDHGAFQIVATSAAMHERLANAVAAGILRRSGDTYASPNGMNSLCRWLLDGLPVQFSTKLTRVEHVESPGESWHLYDEAGASHGPYDAVVLAVPPVNAAEIIRSADAELAHTISSVQMRPCWVAMLAFPETLESVPDTKIVADHLLRRSMSNTVGDAMVIEASEEWSMQNVELDAADAGQQLLEAVRPALAPALPSSVVAHRWRYAFVAQPLGRPFLTSGNGLFVCGDWCLGRSIESAWDSASAAVDSICRS